MADDHTEDTHISSSTQARTTVSSRPSAPRKSPVAVTLTRACKLKGATKLTHPIAGTPTSRPRTRGTGKIPATRPATRQRKASSLNVGKEPLRVPEKEKGAGRKNQRRDREKAPSTRDVRKG
ncbi:hypothetical protein MTO96_017967 [Rhipicephalus appendiculatus]